MKTGISLLTMGAGNVIVLKETLKSFRNICDEVIYGDLLLFPEDREIVASYQDEFNLKIIPFEFDYIFKNGFSSLLNVLASHATNDMVMYMNTSEVVDEDYGIVRTVKNNPDCNTFYFIHRTDPHRWYRTYNRHELQWSGRIHEQLQGTYKPYHRPLFMMADLPKDDYNLHKAKIFDTVKEIVYFTNYMSFIDNPDLIGETDPGWIKFAIDNYDSFKERLLAKGNAYKAFQEGNLYKFMEYAYKNIEQEKFESNDGIEYQSVPKKYLL